MGDARMSSGSEFQTVGASKAKLKPNCLVDCIMSQELPNISKITHLNKAAFTNILDMFRERKIRGIQGETTSVIYSPF